MNLNSLDNYPEHLFEMEPLVTTIAAAFQGIGVCWNTTKVDQTLAWLAWNIIAHVPLLIISALINYLRVVMS